MGAGNSTQISNKSIISKYINTRIENEVTKNVKSSVASSQNFTVDNSKVLEYAAKFNWDINNLPKCNVSNILMDSVITLDNTDTTKATMETSITDKLTDVLKQINENKIDDSIGIFNDMRVEDKTEIITNINHIIKDKLVTNIVNDAMNAQNVLITCGGPTDVNGITIKSVSGLISKSLTDMIVNNTSFAESTSDNSQYNKTEVRSVITQFGDFIQGVLNTLTNPWVMGFILFIIICVMALRFLKPGSKMSNEMDYGSLLALSSIGNHHHKHHNSHHKR